MERELVFKVIAEGGSLKIESQSKGINQGFDYFLIHNETDFSESGMDVNETKVFDNFYEPFEVIHKKYQWHNLHLSFCDEDFREYVAEKLVKKLNRLNAKELREQKNLEDKLEHYFMNEEKPDVKGLQKITVKSIIKVTEYQYDELTDHYAKEIGQKYKMKGSYEMWTDDEPYIRKFMEVINSDNHFQFEGKIKISGNTIILKDEFGLIRYVLPSDKYFVSAEPKRMKYKWSFL